MINDIESQETFKKLQEKYRGLRAEDLCSLNPEYSCVICGSESCDNIGVYNCSCPDHSKVDEAILLYVMISRNAKSKGGNNL